MPFEFRDIPSPPIWDSGGRLIPRTFSIRVIGEEDIALFRQLVQRATNCWEQAPPQIKEFADMVIHGKPLQDYYSQKTGAKREPASQQQAGSTGTSSASTGEDRSQLLGDIPRTTIDGTAISNSASAHGQSALDGAGQPQSLDADQLSAFAKSDPPIPN